MVRVLVSDMIARSTITSSHLLSEFIMQDSSPLVLRAIHGATRETLISSGNKAYTELFVAHQTLQAERNGLRYLSNSVARMIINK